MFVTKKILTFSKLEQFASIGSSNLEHLPQVYVFSPSIMTVAPARGFSASSITVPVIVLSRDCEYPSYWKGTIISRIERIILTGIRFVRINCSLITCELLANRLIIMFRLSIGCG